MMTRQHAKQMMSQLSRSIERIVEEYLNSLYQIASKYFQKDITESIALNQIQNMFYEVFEQVYKLVSKTIKENYKRIAPFDVNNLLDLTYQADGKTLEERILNYLKQNMPKFKLFERLYKLLLNESKILESGVIKGKLSQVASILVIECDENDCHFGCPEYAGEYPADENIPLPPYHPDCACTYYYIETDNEDDIHDLDLDVDEIKEE